MKWDAFPLYNLLASEWELHEGNALDLYLGGAQFEFKLHWITFGGFLQSLQANVKQNLQ